MVELSSRVDVEVESSEVHYSVRQDMLRVQES